MLRLDLENLKFKILDVWIVKYAEVIDRDYSLYLAIITTCSWF